MSGFQQAFFGDACSGEGTFFKSEELRLNQLFWYCCAVDSDERALSARALLVNRACDQFFSGSALAVKQHSRSRRRDLRKLATQASHGRTSTDEAAQSRRLSGARLPRTRISAPRSLRRLALVRRMCSTAALQSRLKRRKQCRTLERLGKKIDGAHLHGPDGVFHLSKCGHQNHGRLSANQRERTQELEPAEIRHTNIGNHDVKLFRTNALKCLLPIGSGHHLIASVIENLTCRLEPLRVVIDEKNACDGTS